MIHGDRSRGGGGRAWPVNPAQYPLSGPSTGPTYCPPEEVSLRVMPGFRGCVAGALAGLAICGAIGFAYLVFNRVL